MKSRVQGRVQEKSSISEQPYVLPDMLVGLFHGKSRIATKSTRHHKNDDFGHHRVVERQRFNPLDAGLAACVAAVPGQRQSQLARRLTPALEREPRRHPPVPGSTQ